MPASLDQEFCLPGPQVISRDFGDEMVVANLDTGLFYSLGGSAPAIWSGLLAGHTGRQIAAALFGSDPATHVTAVARCVSELLAEQLLIPAESTAITAAAAAPAAIAFAEPSLERFDDLQGLLLVDPIHDVSEAGWPVLPPADVTAG